MKASGAKPGLLDGRCTRRQLAGPATAGMLFLCGVPSLLTGGAAGGAGSLGTGAQAAVCADSTANLMYTLHEAAGLNPAVSGPVANKLAATIAKVGCDPNIPAELAINYARDCGAAVAAQTAPPSINTFYQQAGKLLNTERPIPVPGDTPKDRRRELLRVLSEDPKLEICTNLE